VSIHLPVQAVIKEVRVLTVDTTLFTLGVDVPHPHPNLPLEGEGTKSPKSLFLLPAVAGNVLAFLPGQFLQLSLPGVGEIPISYCGSPSTDGTIELCIRHVGHVTNPLKNSAPGDAIGIRGPFGRGFRMPEYVGKDLLLIAGGLGMAPLRSLLLALLAGRDQYGRITILYGARDASVLLFLDELLELKNLGAIELRLSVDHSGHGSDKLPDCQTARLPALLEGLDVDPLRTCAAICGPPVVYPPLVASLKSLRLPDERIHLSLERRMMCGIGRCGHCAVGGHLCCVDGPVFSYAELTGIEGALG
jgi:NAD(P)H-flavin reductase